MLHIEHNSTIQQNPCRTETLEMIFYQKNHFNQWN